MRLRSPYDRQILRYAIPALGTLAAEPLYVLAKDRRANTVTVGTRAELSAS